MSLSILLVAVVGIALLALVGRRLIAAQREARSVDRYLNAMKTLRTIPERLSSPDRASQAADPANPKN